MTATGPASVTISYQMPTADLSLTNSASPSPATSGQPLTYTVTAANTGGQAATGVTVTDPLPASAVFGSMSITQGGTCTRSISTPNKNKDGTVTCSIATLGGGVTATVTITVTPTKPGTLSDTATVTASNVSDSPDTDDSATATATVQGT